MKTMWIQIPLSDFAYSRSLLDDLGISYAYWFESSYVTFKINISDLSVMTYGRLFKNLSSISSAIEFSSKGFFE